MSCTVQFWNGRKKVKTYRSWKSIAHRIRCLLAVEFSFSHVVIDILAIGPEFSVQKFVIEMKISDKKNQIQNLTNEKLQIVRFALVLHFFNQ